LAARITSRWSTGTIYIYGMKRPPDLERGLAAAPSKPASGELKAIEAQIRDEIAVMQGVMISDLRQDEHLVRLEPKEVRRVIEVSVFELFVVGVAGFASPFAFEHKK
jgi:hypothetical protein